MRDRTAMKGTGLEPCSDVPAGSADGRFLPGPGFARVGAVALRCHGVLPGVPWLVPRAHSEQLSRPHASAEVGVLVIL